MISKTLTLLTPAEARKIYPVGINKFNGLIRARAFDVIYEGGRRFVVKESLLAYIERKITPARREFFDKKNRRRV